MPLCNPIGFLAFNNADIISDGYIYTTQARVVTSGKDEVRRILPAKWIQVQFFYQKITSSGNATIGQASGGTSQFSTLGAGIGAGLINVVANDRELGGFSQGVSKFIFQLNEAETVYNFAVMVDPARIISSASGNLIIQVPGSYPLRVFAVTNVRIDFTAEQELLIGDDPARNGVGIGPTGDEKNTGRYSGITMSSLVDEDGFQMSDSSNHFVKIVSDDRLLLFRADNPNPGPYAFYSDNKIDATSQLIETDIPVSTITKPQTFYITGSLCNRRIFRQSIYHLGKFTETSSGSVLGTNDVLNTGNIVSSDSYEICRWLVPVDHNVQKAPLLFPPSDGHLYETVEGWRISEASDMKLSTIFAADQRGIVELNAQDSSLVRLIFPASSLSGQTWFTDYLTENDLQSSNLILDGLSIQGALFDISPATNQRFFDKEKIPYFRPFALAIQKTDSAIGVLQLDAFGPFASGTAIYDAKYDLVNTIFRPANLSSFKASNDEQNSGAYNIQACNSISGQAYYDPEVLDTTRGGTLVSRQNTAIFNPLAATSFAPGGKGGGDLVSQWLLLTPRFFGPFRRKTRVYMELFETEARPAAKFPSNIFIYSQPLIPSQPSADIDPDSQEAILVFRNSTIDSLSYHQFKDGLISRNLSQLKTNPNNNNNSSLDFTKSDFIGSNRLLGDEPSYSDGVPITTEATMIKNGTFPSDFFITEDLTNFNVVSPSSSSSSSFNELSYVSTLSGGNLVKSIFIDYVVAPAGTANSLKDREISINFIEEKNIIDNFYLEVFTGQHKVTLDGAYYAGGEIDIYGKFFQDVLGSTGNMSIKLVTSTRDNFNKVKADSDNFSMVIDGGRRILVFYEDSVNGNISVLLSDDFGSNWYDFKNIIRLSAGEIATRPMALARKATNAVELLYTLNDALLMHVSIDSKNLNPSDLGVVYTPPVLNGLSADDLGLSNYSRDGKILRYEQSSFVHCPLNHPYYLGQKTITDSRVANDKKSRFLFSGDTSSFTGPFDVDSFSFFIDNRGAAWVYYVKEGRLFVKYSSDFISWSFKLQNAIVHKNFTGEAAQNIDSIFTLYDIKKDKVLLFYCFSDMMFYKEYSNSIFYNYDTDRLESMFNDFSRIDASVGISKFLVGLLPLNLVNAIRNNDSSLLFTYPYKNQDPSTFDQNMDIDSNIAPTAYVSANGLVRVFYTDNNIRIRGITIHTDPILDIQLEPI